MKLKNLLAAAALSVGTVGMFASSAHATLVNFKWEGADEATLSGYFSYNSSLSGMIEETDLDEFEMRLYLSGFLVDTWNMTEGTGAFSPFNFNYNSDTRSFAYGGEYTSDPFHISWGDDEFAFVGGSVANGPVLYGFATFDPNFPLDPVFDAYGRSVEDADQFSVSVPVPGSVALLGLGLAGLAATRRRKA